MPENGSGRAGETTSARPWFKRATIQARQMSPEPELLAVLSQPAQTTQDTPDFFPEIDHGNALPPFNRDLAHSPALLETRGVTSQSRQQELLDKRLVLKESIAAKLRSIGAYDLAEPLDRCHTEQSWAQCNGCHKARTFWNRCENFYCPVCQPTLARERTESLEWWAAQIRQPKHVVVTVRNPKAITFQYFKELKRSITKLRRRKFARNWRGGMYAIETTNESKGWHPHVHMLIDSPWIDPRELAENWADIVGQDFAIVWVRDARGTDYLREVCKYNVKGTELAGWTPDEIAHFINAVQGQRMFGVFGTLYGKRTQWADFLKSLRSNKRKCECGCDQWRIYSDQEWAWKIATDGPIIATKPIPPPSPQIDLIK